jgi:hypothetical protein
MQIRKVTAEQIDHLPSDLHKTVARILVDQGTWIVVENNTSGDCRMVSA